MIDWDSTIESEWDLALRKYNDYLVSPEKAARDARVSLMNAYAISLLSADDFRSYLHDEFFVWKYTAKNRLATVRNSFAKMSFSELSEIKNELVSPALSDRQLLKSALKIKGLGCAGATALLSLLYPNRFGTVDQFVVRNLQSANSLNQDPIIIHAKPNSIKFDVAIRVIKLFQLKANELNVRFGKMTWSPRTIDKAVWAAR